MKTNSLQILKVLTLALILAGGIQIAAADWVSAPANPPANNIDAPINSGQSSPDGYQAKLGALWLNTSVSGPNNVGLWVQHGQSWFGGNVGIKVENPTQSLEVNGNIKTGGIYITNTGTAKAGALLTLSNPATGATTWTEPLKSSTGGTYSGTYTTIQRFATSYSTLMSDADFRTWTGNSSMPQNGSDDNGWYVRADNSTFVNTKNRLCSYFMTDGVAVGSYTAGDYGSDNNNHAWYWNPTTSAWEVENHGDNGVIDITSLICAGNGINSRAFKFLI